MTDHPDDGHTVERCNSGIGASTTLQTVRPLEKHFEQRERYWRIQLEYARAREGSHGAAS